MNSSEERFETLLKQVNEYEKNAQRRVWITSIVPLLLGILLLGYTIWQIWVYGQKLVDVQSQLNEKSNELVVAMTSLQDTQGQLDDTLASLDSAQTNLAQTITVLEQTKEELDKSNRDLERTKKELQDANIFVNYIYEIDVAAAKSLYNELPSRASLLFDIIGLQSSGVGWNSEGFSDGKGFNSPSFAMYILQRNGLVSGGYDLNTKPWEILKPINYPRIGDLVYYEGGYTMFYFNLKGESFVIGMTPLGILAQKLGFAPVLGYLEVPYKFR